MISNMMASLALQFCIIFSSIWPLYVINYISLACVMFADLFAITDFALLVVWRNGD